MKNLCNSPAAVDYPAAHSMDTVWFAVDQDGHVAAFESYEGGAVPNDALNDQQGAIDPLEELRQHVKPCEIIYTLEDQRSPLQKDRQHALPQKPYRQPPRTSLLRQLLRKLTGQTAGPAAGSNSTERADEEQLIAPVIMFLPNFEVVAAELANGTCQKIKTSGQPAVFFKHLPISLYRAIHKRNQCGGCYYLFALADDNEFAREYSRSGLFHYICCESQMAVPYGRHTTPDVPLNVRDLLAELRGELMKLQFTNLAFERTAYIQPAERVPSYTWDGGFLRENWKTFQANPGQEKEYQELYEQMAEEGYFEGITFEPPRA